MIPIYSYSTGQVKTMIEPLINSQQEKVMMSQNAITLVFQLAVAVQFSRGDYANVFGERYTLNVPYTGTKNAQRKYDYTLVLEGEEQDLGRTQYFTYNANNQITESKFSLRGRPIDFCELIIKNLNRMYPNKWSLGGVIEGDYKVLDFEGNNCLEVLSNLAQQYETEFQIQNGKVYLKKNQPISGITLKHGQEEALYKITRQPVDNANITTRLYAFGSDKNIGDNYRNGAQRLRLPNRFIERNVNLHGVSEATQVFEEVYPRREAALTAVTSPLVFVDNTINFNINDSLIPGVTAKMTFNTGLLAGYTFELASYDHVTKTITINQNADSQTLTLPNDTLFASVGDKYVLVDILMPLEYVTAAEAELATKAQSWLEKYSVERLAYTIECNNLWFKNNSKAFVIGQSLNLVDVDLAIDRQIRVVGFTRNLRNPWVFSATLADTINPQQLLVQLLNVK